MVWSYRRTALFNFPGFSTTDIMASFYLCLILSCSALCLFISKATAYSDEPTWSGDNCPLTEIGCDCFPMEKKVACGLQGRSVGSFDTEDLEDDTFRTVTTIDLRYNALRSLPAAEELQRVFPDLQEIKVDGNSNLDCDSIHRLLSGYNGTLRVTSKPRHCWRRRSSPSTVTFKTTTSTADSDQHPTVTPNAAAADAVVTPISTSTGTGTEQATLQMLPAPSLPTGNGTATNSSATPAPLPATVIQGWIANATSGFVVGNSTAEVYSCLKQCRESWSPRCRMVSYNIETGACTLFMKAAVTDVDKNGNSTFGFYRDNDGIIAAHSEKRLHLLEYVKTYGKYISEPLDVRSSEMCKDLCHVHPTCNAAVIQMHQNVIGNCKLQDMGVREEDIFNRRFPAINDSRYNGRLTKFHAYVSK